MDGNFLLLLFFWVVNNAFMYRIGYTRALNEALKLAEDMHAPVQTEDGAYWKTRYEELAAEWDNLPKVFPKGLLHKDYDEREDNAPGETTE